MSAYLVFIREATLDPSALATYAGQVAATTRRVMPSRHWPSVGGSRRWKGADAESVALFEFPSFEAARAWYDSPAYRAVREHRFTGSEVPRPADGRDQRQPRLVQPSSRTMPLVRFDAVAGRSQEEVKCLLDAAHRALLISAFKVPPRDRYQVYHEHPASHLVVQDTGLGIERTDQVIIVTVTTRPRRQEEKLSFYRELCRELEQSCQIKPGDVVVSLVTNTDADWSFGHGAAQFITGEL